MPPRPKKPRVNPYLVNGKLIDPPRQTPADLEAARKKKEEKELEKKREAPGIITFDDLYSGRYWEQKRAEELKKQKRKEARENKKKMEKKEKEKQIQM